MKDLFRTDSRFSLFMTTVFDLVCLNVLWLLCCIPVITIGAATTALYGMTMKMVRGEEGAIVKGFFRYFRDNFRQSVPMTLILLAFAGVMAADLHILGNASDLHILGNAPGEVSSLLYGGCLALLLLGAAVAGYAFPLLARFENTVKNTIANAAGIVATHPGQTAAILAVNLIPAIWFIASPETFSRIFWIWAFAGTGGAAYVNSLLLVRIFDEFTEQE